MTTEQAIAAEVRRKITVPAGVDDAELLRQVDGTLTLDLARLAVACREFWSEIKRTVFSRT